jgi:hypothetical protein
MSLPATLRVARLSHPAEAASRSSFWAKVNMLGQCWIWTGARTPAGYGKVGYGGRYYGAHRCAFEYTFGRPEDGLFVCHHCDNPPCVNPAHLYAGTPADNTADMYERGRAGLTGPVGIRNSHAVLNEEQVRQIRGMFATGASTRDLARTFGITSGYVNRILNGKTWPDAGGPICTTDRRGRHGNHARGVDHPKSKGRTA